MTIIKCPVAGCLWQSEDLSEAFAPVIVTQLQMHEKAAHTSPPDPKPHKLQIDPPKFDVGASPEEWESFKRQWSMYKTGTAIPDCQAPTALFYCCSEGLRLDIMRDIRLDVASMKETDLLAEIRRLAVKEESILVQRMKLGKLTQAPGMGIRTFAANLRGQASLCNFTVKCTETDCNHTFDYSQEIIKDNLVRGIADPEILADLLGDPKTDRTLEEIILFVSQKEQAKATRTAVGDCAAPISTLKNSPAPRWNSSRQGKCWACDGQNHGPRNDKLTRERLCPAWNNTCNKCNIKGHFNKCCNKCISCGNWGHRDNKSRFCRRTYGGQGKPRAFQTEDENLHTNQLVAMQNSKPRMHQRKIEHHIFEDKWIPRPSKPHPTVIAELMPLPEEHAIFGSNTPASKLKSTCIPMVADSGCQSCIIPLATAQAMGYRKSDLMPVQLSMRGAIKEDLGVEGGIILEIIVEDQEKNKISCKQMVYVSEKMNKAFLCREALEQYAFFLKNFLMSKWTNSQALRLKVAHATAQNALRTHHLYLQNYLRESRAQTKISRN